jgi:hypothetical protein
VKSAAFAYVNAFRAHVNVGFFRGAELPDPRGLLEGTGRMMRHVKLRPADGIDATALRRLIRTAYADIKQQLEAELERQEQGRVRSCPTPPPEELKPTKPGTRRCCAA